MCRFIGSHQVGPPGGGRVLRLEEGLEGGRDWSGMCPGRRASSQRGLHQWVSGASGGLCGQAEKVKEDIVGEKVREALGEGHAGPRGWALPKCIRE